MRRKGKIVNTSARGFTLMEMVAVLFVLGLIAGLSLPNIYSAIQNFRLNSAARKMTADIRYAREMALSRHGTYGITVSADTNTYSIFSLSGSTKTVLTDSWRQLPLSVTLDGTSGYAGVTMGTVDLCESGGCPLVDLRFDSFGTPSDSSGTAMASNATIQLQSGGVTKTVTIQPETGFCEIT
ncbi:MAG: hypothetical protein A2Y02_03005 [Omnitrophica bacterium GWA2_52_12]|nr:MAG: hypothetical protein A2Y02_03005 [Omnitrophica bacterium GWA2_52_12]